VANRCVLEDGTPSADEGAGPRELKFLEVSSETTVVIQQWVIVARHDVRLFEALASAFWRRREFSVVLDRRETETPRRLRERMSPSERRHAPPLNLKSEQFCVVNTTAGLSAELDDRFPP
jgi:hypothetical protein